MSLIKKGTFGRSYARNMEKETVSMKCFACKKTVTFDPIIDETPSLCPHCGCKDMRTCIGDSGVCDCCQNPKEK